MNCFDRVERSLFTGSELPQGFDAALQALLVVSSAGYANADTFASNAARETLHRWRNLNPFFVAAATQRLNTLQQAIESGRTNI
jgi:hypothetical protein